jgi:hypothetical protein
MGIVIDVSAEPESGTTTPPLIVEYKNIVSIKTGTYTIASKQQSLATLGPAVCDAYCLYFGASPSYPRSPLPIEISSSSSKVVNLAYERRTNRGFSYSGEILHISNSFVIPLSNTAPAPMNTTFLFATIKKYFGDPNSLRPYFAGGIGVASANLRGSINRTKSGLAAQILTGISYQFGRTSLFAEYRYVYAPTLSLPSAKKTGDIEGSLNLSGQAYFIGLGVNF